MYVPLAQMADAQMALFNRLSVPATWAVRFVPAALVPGDPVGAQAFVAGTGLPAARARTMDEVFDASTAPTAQNTWLISAIGTMSLARRRARRVCPRGAIFSKHRHMNWVSGWQSALGGLSDVRRMVM